MFEEQQFFKERKGSRLRRNSLGAEDCDAEYGTKAYFDFFQSQDARFEFLIARDHFKISCFLDSRGYFVIDPPSLGLISLNDNFTQVSEWRKIYPFASVDLSRVLAHYKAGSVTDSISCNCAAVSIMDTSDTNLIHPKLVQILDPSQGGRHGYGYSEFRYDLSGPQELSLPQGVPLKIVSLFSSLSSWRTTYVEVLEPDICSRDLRPLWLLVDYFSLYFRSPTYGNPYCFDFLHEPSLVYGGSDLRIILWRPMMMALSEPASKETQYIILESGSFVAYRFMLDSSGGYKVVAQPNDLALVLVKQLRTVNRGLRGAAGSGRGVRTVLEHLSMRLFHHHNPVDRSTDFVVDVLSTEELFRESNFDWDDVSVSSAQAVQTTCVENMEVFPRVFPRTPINVVSSFADAVLCMSLISCFLEASADPNPGDRSIFCVVKMTGLRLVIVDNVVGLHLPLIQFYIEDVSITLDGGSVLPLEGDTEKKYRLFWSMRCFADYFNYTCRCWEPMLEPIICESIYEQLGRCRGLSIRSRSNFHVNISGESIKALSNLSKAMGDQYPLYAASSSTLDLDAEGGGNRAQLFSRRSSISITAVPLVENLDA